MKRLAIDFGSSVTKIYISGCGVVLMEATCIAVEEYIEDGEKCLNIKAFGDKARALSGRAAVNTQIINPVFEGDIVHENLAACLLQYFLEKIEIPRRKAKHTEVMFILPCGCKPELKEKYQRIADECGISMAYFTLTPFAAVLGHNVAISESRPMFCLDIGYGITNIAALSQDGIISGINVNLGGGNIDVHLIDVLAENHDIKIGALTAERVKNVVGSLLNDDNKLTVVDGREVSGGAPVSIAVNSSQVYEIITTYVDKILEYVSLVMAKLPAEVSSSVMRGGVYLSGGLVKMDGLAEYIEEKLQIPVNVPEEPQLAAVIGAGTILSSDRLWDKLATVSD
ncbi:MAG: rod shape-determining protein [Clostridia bacterium]|nr:rod shape-determining protein [Clostridia bacterium]